MSQIKELPGIPLNQKKNAASVGSRLKYIPEEIRNVAKGQEKVFAKMMFEQMQKGIASQKDSSASSFYKDLMLEERAQKMVDQEGGLGIQEVILDQLYPKKFRNPLALRAYEQNKENRRLAFQKDKIEMMKKQNPSGYNAIKMKNSGQEEIQQVKTNRGLPLKENK